MASQDTSNRGFASMDSDTQRDIASKGGHASGGNFKNDPERAAEAGHKGGQASGGNFAHDREKASEAGRAGGEASHGGASRQDAPGATSRGGSHEQHVNAGHQSHKSG